MDNVEVKIVRPTVQECPSCDVPTAQAHYAKVNMVNGKLKPNLYAEMNFR